MSERPSIEPLLQRVLDVVLHAPIDVVTHLRNDVPRLVADGRTQIENRVRVARWVGEMAVHVGSKQLHERLNPPVAAPAAPAPSSEPPVSPHLSQPFEGYDNLAAAQIVQLLGRLPHVELHMVRDYEAAGRRRRTILAKIDQLLA